MNDEHPGDSSQSEAFWSHGPILPDGLELHREGAIAVPRRGPGGATFYDQALLDTPGGPVRLVIGHRDPLDLGELDALATRLHDVVQQLRSRTDPGATPATRVVPVVGTRSAGANAVAACAARGLGIVDREGTLVLRAGPIFVHVERAPRQRSSRAKGSLDSHFFVGKSARVVRALLSEVVYDTSGRPWSVKDVADACGLTYTPCYAALVALERHGFVSRPSPRGGFRVSDPAGLIRAWAAAGSSASWRAEGFNAPDTTASALRRAAETLTRSEPSARFAFTLASAIAPDEFHVAALPHGLYVHGDRRAVVEALALRRITPSNFFLLQPEPFAAGKLGGVFSWTRPLDHGPGVALPQLIVDLRAAPGRGAEQSDFLLARYLENLPFQELVP